ncbi:MAG: hypothetical protein ABIJ96_00135 [Elusimicrobiota bacterium]
MAELGNNPFLLWTIGTLAALVVIGFVTSLRVKSASDFYRAGKKVPAWAVAISLVAAEMSVITVLGLSAEAYAKDWRYVHFFLGAAAGRVVVAALFVPAFYAAGDPSIYQYLRGRFGPPVQYAASGLFCATRLTGGAVRLLLAAITVSILTGVPPHFILVPVCLVSVCYLGFGGAAAAVWGGVLQAAVITGAGLALLVFLQGRLQGGVGELMHVAREAGRLDLWGRGAGDSMAAAMLGAFVGALWSFGADQEMMQRVLCVRDMRAGRRALLASIPLAGAAMAVFLAAGTGIFLYYEQHPELALPPHASYIFSHFSVQVLPEPLLGLLAAAILMAAVDLPLVGLATVAVRDFPFFRQARKRGQSQLLNVFSAVLAAGALSAGLAFLLLSHTEWIWRAIRASGLLMSPVLGAFVIGICTRWRVPRACAWVVPSVAGANLLLLAGSEYGALPLGWRGLMVFGVFGTVILVRLLGPLLDGRKFANKGTSKGTGY